MGEMKFSNPREIEYLELYLFKIVTDFQILNL